MARKIDALLAEYGESHQNPTNKLVHWVCVPVIFWTIVALLWAIPLPAAMVGIPFLNWATVALGLAMVYYLLLAPRLAVGVILYCLFCIWLITLYAGPWPLWQFAIALFVLAWVGQFWGHKVEGKKPSFFKDVQFLLIGPAWLISFVYRRLGLKY
jgi:uncharacterized membrane protein YGL010W